MLEQKRSLFVCLFVRLFVLCAKQRINRWNEDRQWDPLSHLLHKSHYVTTDVLCHSAKPLKPRMLNGGHFKRFWHCFDLCFVLWVLWEFEKCWCAFLWKGKYKLVRFGHLSSLMCKWFVTLDYFHFVRAALWNETRTYEKTISFYACYNKYVYAWSRQSQNSSNSWELHCIQA